MSDGGGVVELVQELVLHAMAMGMPMLLLTRRW